MTEPYATDETAKSARPSLLPVTTLKHFWRLLVLAGKGFMRDDGLNRASALAFDTILGLVPFLAFLVSALKGFGAYQTLMRDMIRPGIVSSMMSMGAQQNRQGVGLLGVFLRVLDIVDQASFGAIGVFGLVFLLYIVVLLLVSIEECMNHIFGVQRSRSIGRRLADYSAIMFVTPVCMILIAGLLAGFEKSAFFMGSMPWQFFVAVGMIVCLTSLYWVMPHRPVRLRSAAVGGAFAGVVWYLALTVHVHFQVGVARYNALYSTVAAVPLFLVWLFVSWIVVLMGAEMAAAHDNAMQHAWRIRGKDIDHASRLFIALGGLIAVARRHLLGEPPIALSKLAQQMSLPEPLVRYQLAPFVTAELLVSGWRGKEPTYSLARDVDTIHLGQLLRILECSWNQAPLLTDAERNLRNLLETRVMTRDADTERLSLRELVGFSFPNDGKGRAEWRIPAPPNGSPVDSPQRERETPPSIIPEENGTGRTEERKS